jgi:hypothetical protein
MAYSKQKSTNIVIIDNPPQPNSWQITDAKREDAVAEYMKNFMEASTIYRQAIEDGWSSDLYRYIHGVAMVQAQMIYPQTGQEGISWSSVDILGFKFTDEDRKSFFAEQKRIADRGNIDVGLPTSRLEHFKQIAEWARSKFTADRKDLKVPESPKAKIGAHEAPAPKTNLDLEIDRQMEVRCA